MLQIPGRQVVTRSPHRRVGYISCPWFQNQQIQYESLLEQSFVRIALLCPGVSSIESQPFRLDLPSGGTYTPDFLVRCDSAQPIVVEVKPQAFIGKHRSKLQEAAACLESHGYRFLLSTNEEIHFDGRAERAALILRYARGAGRAHHSAELAVTLPLLTYPLPLSDIARACGLSIHQALGLVGCRHLYLDHDLGLDQVYDLNTLMEANDGDFSASAWLRCADW